MRPEYKALIKEAKSNGIETVSELEDLISEKYESITGGEYECAIKYLKLTR